MTEIQKSEVKRGRKEENTLRMNWKSRLESVWVRFPASKKTLKDLHGETQAINPVVARGLANFRKKMDGRLGSDDMFGHAVFEASGLAQFGLSQDAFLAVDDVWHEEVESLDGVDARPVFDALLTTKTTALRISAVSQKLSTTPVDHPHLRKITSNLPEVSLRIGSKLCMEIMYDGDAPLYAGHVLALEYDHSQYDWQAFSAIKGSGLDHDKAHQFVLDKAGRKATINLALPIGAPVSVFDLYVFVRRDRFDHRLRGLLEGVESRKEGVLSHREMVQVTRMLEGDRDNLLVAKTTFGVN